MQNLVILSGKIMSLKAIGQNKDTAVFSIAVSKKNAQEEWVSSYFPCIAFKKVALTLLAANPEKLTATVIGTLDINEYQPADQNLPKVYKTQVICNKVLMEPVAPESSAKPGSEFDNYKF